jgi:hypothetical protein
MSAEPEPRPNPPAAPEVGSWPAEPDGSPAEAAGAGSDGRERLRKEHELDDVGRYDATPLAGGGGAEIEGVPPPRSGMPRRTRFLVFALVGALFFLAGIQCQKLAGEGRGGQREGPAAGRPQLPASSGPAATIAHGEIVAIRDTAIYVREADGRTVKVTATPGSRVSRGAPVGLGDVRPGERVAVEATRGADGRLEAITITVLPPRSGAGAR